MRRFGRAPSATRVRPQLHDPGRAGSADDQGSVGGRRQQRDDKPGMKVAGPGRSRSELRATDVDPCVLVGALRERFMLGPGRCCRAATRPWTVRLRCAANWWRWTACARAHDRWEGRGPVE